MKTSNVVIFLKDCQILRFDEDMPCGACNFNFYKNNITTPQSFLSFPRVSHFSNMGSSTVYTKSALDMMGQFFLKMMLEDMSE